MNSMLFGLFVAGVLAQQPTPKEQTPAAPAAQAQEKPVSANLKVRVGTSTYLPDGRVLTASASDWPLTINKPVTIYAASGKNMCEPHAATLDQPALPAYGWQVKVVPVREAAGELEVQVQWRQLHLAPKATFDRMQFGASTTLTLHTGDRIVMDYIGASETGSPLLGYRLAIKNPKSMAWTTRPAAAATTANTSDCKAVGMSLEIGLEPAKTEAIVEAELWLVRPNRDGTELSERQVLRLPIGQPPSSYYFDEARLIAAPAKPGGTYAKVSGELGAFAVENGKIHFNFKVARRYELKAPNADATSTYRDLVATPGEVLAFQLPAMEVPALLTWLTTREVTQKGETTTLPPLSVRLRAQVLK